MSTLRNRVGLGVGLGVGVPVVAGGAYAVLKKLRTPLPKMSGSMHLPMVMGDDDDDDDEHARKERSPHAAV